MSEPLIANQLRRSSGIRNALANLLACHSGSIYAGNLPRLNFGISALLGIVSEDFRDAESRHAVLMLLVCRTACPISWANVNRALCIPFSKASYVPGERIIVFSLKSVCASSGRGRFSIPYEKPILFRSQNSKSRAKESGCRNERRSGNNFLIVVSAIALI